MKTMMMFFFYNYTGDDLSNLIDDSFCRASSPEKDASITNEFDQESFEVLPTDSTFQNRVVAMYDACVKNNNYAINIKQEIAKVMMGSIIRYNAQWGLVDNNLSPVFICEHKHWLLGRLSFADKKFHVYNTLKCDGVKEILYFDDKKKIPKGQLDIGAHRSRLTLLFSHMAWQSKYMATRARERIQHEMRRQRDL
ncbi:hypothetical protein ACET3Z_027702 [Daucus carota]